MRDLLPFAIELAEAVGGFREASNAAFALVEGGVEGIDGIGPDTRLALRERARELAVTNEDGHADAGRCAELALVCDLLATFPSPSPMAAPSPSLVYTVPEEAAGLVEPRERLDLLVDRTIRMARSTVHLGGPFWDESGLERLARVLSPAIIERRVQCSLYVHYWPEERRRALIRRWTSGLASEGQLALYWYRGPAESLMHAKFVVGDGTRGYLGTANLTSFGLGQHVEIGLELGAQQSAELVGFLDRLVASGLLRPDAQLGANEELR